jgi:hypothetical protein
MPTSTKQPHPTGAISQKSTNRLLAVCFYLLSSLRGKQDPRASAAQSHPVFSYPSPSASRKRALIADHKAESGLQTY